MRSSRARWGERGAFETPKGATAGRAVFAVGYTRLSLVFVLVVISRSGRCCLFPRREGFTPRSRSSGGDSSPPPPPVVACGMSILHARFRPRFPLVGLCRVGSSKPSALFASDWSSTPEFTPNRCCGARGCNHYKYNDQGDRNVAYGSPTCGRGASSSFSFFFSIWYLLYKYYATSKT